MEAAVEVETSTDMAIMVDTTVTLEVVVAAVAATVMDTSEEVHAKDDVLNHVFEFYIDLTAFFHNPVAGGRGGNGGGGGYGGDCYNNGFGGDGMCLVSL